MSRRPSKFVTCGVVAIYLGIPLVMLVIGCAIFAWVYGQG